ALGEEYDRQVIASGEVEHPVGLAMVLVSLGAGENGVVIRHHATAGSGRSEEVGVDGRHASDEPIGWRALDELRQTAALSLGGDRQCSILDEAAWIAHVVDVLPGRALSRRPAPGDGRGPGRIEATRVAAP